MRYIFFFMSTWPCSISRLPYLWLSWCLSYHYLRRLLVTSSKITWKKNLQMFHIFEDYFKINLQIFNLHEYILKTVLQIFKSFKTKKNGFSPSFFICIKNLRRLKSSFGLWNVSVKLLSELLFHLKNGWIETVVLSLFDFFWRFIGVLLMFWYRIPTES